MKKKKLFLNEIVRKYHRRQTLQDWSINAWGFALSMGDLDNELEAFHKCDWTFLRRVSKSIDVSWSTLSDLCKIFPLFLMSELKDSLGELKSDSRDWLCVASLVSDSILASYIAIRHSESFCFDIQECRCYRDDPHLVALSVERDVDSFRYASHKLRDDDLFVQELMISHPRVLAHASRRLRDKRRLAFSALEKCGNILFDLPLKWPQDRETLLTAAKNDERLLHRVEYSFLDDLFMTTAKKKDSTTQRASSTLISNSDTMVAVSENQDQGNCRTEPQSCASYSKSESDLLPSDRETSDNESQTMTTFTFRNLVGDPLIFDDQSLQSKSFWEEKISQKLNVPRCLVSVHVSECNSELGSENESVEGSLNGSSSADLISGVLTPGEEYSYLLGSQTFPLSGGVPSLEDSSFWTHDKVEVLIFLFKFVLNVVSKS